MEESPLANDASPALGKIEKKQIIRVLEQTKGNRKQAVEMLGIWRSTLYCKMKAYGIE